VVEQLRQEQEPEQEPKQAPKRVSVRLPAPAARMLRSALAAAAIIAISWGVIYLGAARADQAARHNLLMRARASAALLDPGDIADLIQHASGPSPTSSETFVRVLDRLRALCETSDDARFVYIVIPVDGQVVAILDSEPEDSPNYSPPGQSMYPATPGQMALFASVAAGVEGPRTDPWGTWITAYAPITANGGNSPVAFLAMDVDASAWPKYSLVQWAPIFLTVAFLAALAVFMVISRYNRESRHARYLAERDYLTGLANRAALIRAIDRAILQAKKGKPSALLAIDIDNFKALNDTHGEANGNRVLKEVGRIFRSATRIHDLVARFGADTFAMLLPETPFAGAKTVAAKLKGNLSDTKIRAGTRSIQVTGSFGIASSSKATSKPADLLRMAEKALKMAKKRGGNQIA